MRKQLQLMLLFVLMCIIGTTQAQVTNFTCDFEAVSDTSGWVFHNDGDSPNKWFIDTAVNNTIGGSKALYVSSDTNGATHTYDPDGTIFIYAYKEFTLSAGEYDISYDWIANGEGNSYSIWDYLRVALVPATATLPESVPYSFDDETPSGWIALDEGIALYNSTSWTNKVVTATIATTGDYKLVFFWRNDFSGGENPPAAIDNIVLKAQTCPKPSNLVASNFTIEGATISWTEMGTAAEWQIEYGPTGFAQGTGTVESTTENPYTIIGLEANTIYDVYVNSVCSSDDSSLSVKTTFRTACGDMVLPLTETFESYEEYAFPPCWFSKSGDAEVYEYSSNAYNGQKSLKLTKNAVILTPKFTIPANEAAIYFAAMQYTTTAGNLEIGYVSDTAIWDYVELTTIAPLDDDYHLYDINLESIEEIPDECYIVLSQVGATSNYSSWYIDDVNLYQLGDCRSASDFVFSNITNTSATLSWTCVSDGADFQIRYNNTVVDVTGATSITLTDLLPNMVYNVEIRTMCNGTDSTFWHPMGTFKTEITCASLANLRTEGISSNSAAISWDFANNGNDHTGVFFQYKLDSVETWTTVPVSDNGYILTGLTPSTKYNVKVAVLCDQDTSSLMTVSFVTRTDACGVVAGDCEYSTSTAPFNGYNKYSFTQSLYTSAEMGNIDTIRAIKYNTTSNAQTRSINVYIANTDLNYITPTDCIPLANMTKVYSGDYSFTASGWDEITFTAPFVSDGRNVVICVADTTGSWNRDYTKFYYHAGSTIYKHQDGYEAIDPETATFYTTSNVPDVHFVGNCSPITCKAPTVALNSTDANSLTFSWVAGLDETEWTVDYRAVNAASWISVSENTTDTFATISDLMPGTAYEVRVGSLCTDDTLYAEASGVTSCGLLTIPYFEDFASNNLNACWRAGCIDPTSYRRASVSSHELGISSNCYVIMSAFDTEINTLQLRFKMDVTYDDAPLYVGVCSELNNISSFVVVDTAYIDPLDPNADVLVRFNSYEGDGQYIAIKAGQKSVDIDDIHVELIPSCPAPIHVHATAIGGTYINVAWDADASISAWNATIVEHGADISTGSAIVCSDASVEFTGLTTNTEYDIYISSDCSNTTSENAMISATTIGTDPLALPYSTDFSDNVANTQWSYFSVIGDNKFVTGVAESNVTPNALYVSNNNGVNNSYTTDDNSVAFAYVPVAVAEDGMYALQFDWKCNGEKSRYNTYDFGRAVLVPSSYDLNTAPSSNTDYRETLPTGWIAMDNGTLVGQNSWQIVAQKHNLTAGTYYLLFVWTNDGSSGDQPPLAVDNVTFSHVTCAEPTGVHVTDLTSTSATVYWNADDMATNGWEVSINGGEAISVTDTFYTFDDLTSGTGYTVSVRTICSDEDISMAATTTFFTVCGDIETLPYAANFDLYTNDEQPRCWTAAISTYPKVEDGQLKFYSSTYGNSYSMISMPRLSSNIDFHTTELSFRAKGNSSYEEKYLYVGVNTIAGEDTTFTLLETFSLLDEWQDCVVLFGDYTDTGRYITFKNSVGESYNSAVYVDDIMLKAASPCSRPTQVSIDSYTHNTAVISWSDTNASASFKIAYATSNNVDQATVIDNIPSSPYTLSNLSGATNYFVWVASDCGSDIVSGWVYAGSFTTNPTCGRVTDMQVTDIDESHATISWRAPILGEPVTDYIVSVKMNSNAPTIDTIQVPYIFLSNLSTDSNYVVTVTTLCDTVVSEDNQVSFVPVPTPGCNYVGTDNETTVYAPIYSNYNYSISQMIYTADDVVGMGDTINGITFNRYSYSWNGTSDTREIIVYMGMTDLNDCSTGWVDTNSLTVVYRGSWNVDNGLCAINFTAPFIYNDRSKNILLMFDDNTGDYKSSQFYCTETENVMTIHAHSDGVNVSTASQYSESYDRPNIIFDATCAPITCFPPSIVVSNLTDTEVAMVWRAGGDENSWKVDYRNINDPDWTVISASTSNTTATVNGLTPGETYNFRVTSLCGTENASRTIALTTECGPMPTPFTEDFTHIATGTFHKDCWHAASDHYYTRPQVAELVGGSKVLLLSDNGYVILPQIQGNLNDLQIRLRYLATVDTAFAVVGYVPNADDFSTFHAVDTIYDVDFISGTYNTVLFNNIPASATGQIAIYTPQTFAQVVVDDIIVEPIRTCVEPTNIQVSNITTNSANVSWNGTASNYQVVYGETGFIVRGEAGTTMNVSSASATITGLTAGISYDVAVRSICGAGDTSYTSNVVRFTTECDAITSLPYVMNFYLPYLPPLYETGMVPNCWTIAYVDDTAASHEAYPQIVGERTGDHFAINDRHALRMETPSMVALPEMGMDIDTLCLRFFNKVQTPSSRILVGVLDHLGDGCESTFQVIDTIVPAQVGTVEPYVVYLNNYTGTGKYITLRNIDLDVNAPSAVQYFDSVVVDYIPSCPEVINVEAIAATSTTITLDWDDILAPADSYEVVYGSVGTAMYNGTSVIANAHPFTIAGLNTLSSYEIWVRPICGAGDTGFFTLRPIVAQTSMCDNPTEFTTAANGATGLSSEYPLAAWYGSSYSQTIIDAQYLAGMEDISLIKLTESKSSNGKMDSVRIWIAHTDKTEFTSTSDWTSTDSMSLVFTGDLVYENGNVMIPLDSAFAYDGASNLNIAILREADAFEQGHDFETVSDSLNKTLYTHVDWEALNPNNPPLEDAGLAQAHAAFRFVSCGGGCAAPILTNVTDLTYQSATIHWTGTSTDFEVTIRPQDDPVMPTPIAVTANQYTFDNLTPSVTYIYAVRQICEDGATSSWSESTFTTEDLPCFAPTNVSVVSTNAESITLSWSAAEGQSKWAIRAQHSTGDIIDTVTDNPGTITGLTGGLTYQVSVQAICATNYASEWSDAIEVTTTDCLPVSNVTVNNITTNSAKISWTAGGTEASWQINYGLEDFGQGEGEMVDATTNSYTLQNLDEETTYDVYVRAMCSAEFTSIWSEKVSFTTEAGTPEGIDGVEGNFNFVIYPNPTSGATTISLQGVEGQVTISVVDMNGRTITTESIECGSDCEKRMDVAGLAQGTYFVRILGDNLNSVRKLIVR